MNKISKALKFFFNLLKYNMISRLGISLLLFAIFLKLSQYNSIYKYPAIFFSIYPIWLAFWMIMYAWIINPIREALPNSWFTKKVIPHIDNLIDR